MARLLKRYRIKPRTVRIEGRTAKGYHREQFDKAWERYGGDFAVTPVTSQCSSGILGVTEPSQTAQRDGSEKAENAHGVRDVTGVTPETRPEATPAHIEPDFQAESIKRVERLGEELFPPSVRALMNANHGQDYECPCPGGGYPDGDGCCTRCWGRSQ